MDFSQLKLKDLQQEARTRSLRYAGKKKEELIAELIAYETRVAPLQQEEARREEEKRVRQEESSRLRPPTLRRQSISEEEALEILDEPFEAVQDYGVEVTPIFGQPIEDVGNFPQNIQEYLWVNLEVNEEDEEGFIIDRSWRALFQLDNCIYVYFKAGCDYTGFECQGFIKMWASRNPGVLIKYAMNDNDFQAYERETVPI